MVNSIPKKLRTLIKHPDRVFLKYGNRLMLKLVGGIPPIYDENYDAHWNFTSFKRKVILDLGADYGSTAYYFLKKGAKKIIAVEGNPDLTRKLRFNFKNDDRVVCIEKFIDDAEKISELIQYYNPDLVKVDIEGYEKHILKVPIIILKTVREWLIEAHSDEIYNLLSCYLTKHNFRIGSFKNRNLKIIHAMSTNYCVAEKI